MTPPEPCQARRYAGWLLISISTPVASISGQEFLPIVEARAVERVEQQSRPTRASGRGWAEEGPAQSGWDLKLIVKAAYDDNIFLSANRPESDVVMVVTPEIAYAFGERGAEQGAFVRAAYRPSGVLYMDHDGENRMDHDFALAMGWHGRAMSVAYDGRYQRLGDVTADAGAPTDRDEFTSVVRVAWYPREKLAIEGGAGISGTNYDQPGFFDSDGRFGEVALRYAYSPKTQVGIAYRAGRLDVDGSGEQTVHRVTARMAWKPRSKVVLDLEAGVEHRSFDLGSSTDPVAEGRVTWIPRAGTELYFAGYLREEASGFYPGQNYRLGGVSAGISESLGGGWTASIEGGYEHASYHRVSGTGPAGRKDEIVFVRPALEYQLNDRFKAGLFYQYSRNRSNRAGFGYDDHQVGVRLDYQF